MRRSGPRGCCCQLARGHQGPPRRTPAPPLPPQAPAPPTVGMPRPVTPEEELECMWSGDGAWCARATRWPRAHGSTAPARGPMQAAAPPIMPRVHGYARMRCGGRRVEAGRGRAAKRTHAACTPAHPQVERGYGKVQSQEPPRVRRAPTPYSGDDASLGLRRPSIARAFGSCRMLPVRQASSRNLGSSSDEVSCWARRVKIRSNSTIPSKGSNGFVPEQRVVHQTTQRQQFVAPTRRHKACIASALHRPCLPCVPGAIH